MTHTTNGRSVPHRVMEGPRQEAPGTERARPEPQADALALVDETLIRIESVDNGKTVPPATRREDRLGRRLRRSVMFADARKS
jgi:hypothetical protein